MKLKSIAFFAVLVIASSCGINDLEDRVGKIEKALGTNEPFTVKFNTTNGSNVAVVNNATYLFKAGGDSEYMGKYSDGDEYVDIYIERFSDVEWYEGAWISFTYNLTTKEISDEEAGTYFYNQFEDYMNVDFRYYFDNCTTTIEINSINVETGAIDVTVEAATTAASSQNWYSGKAMTGSFKFKGKLPVRDWN